MGVGDFVRWVPKDSPGCETRELEAGAYASSTVGTNGSLTFTIATPGIYDLCYRWNYLDTSGSPTPYIRIPTIELLMISVQEKSTIQPQGTTTDCVTSITILGQGFNLLSPTRLPITCKYGTDGALGALAPTVRNNTHLLCPTPAFTTAGPAPISLDFGGVRTMSALDTFVVVDHAIINSVFPAGGVFNVELDRGLEALHV